MTTEKTTVTLGWRVFGVGMVILAIVCLALGDFLPGQTVPKDFPARTALAYAVGVFMLVASAAIEWRRTTAWGAAALTAYYTLVVVILMGGRVIIRHYKEFIAYTNATEQLAIAAAALVVYATNARIDATLARRLTRVGQLTFGVCALFFGAAHFVYMNLTAPLVPRWLPPSQVFWGYATGIGFVAAGVALLAGVQARLAAILLTAMLASFTFLVHGPMLAADSLQSRRLGGERDQSGVDRRRLGGGGLVRAQEGLAEQLWLESKIATACRRPRREVERRKRPLLPIYERSNFQISRPFRPSLNINLETTS